MMDQQRLFVLAFGRVTRHEREAAAFTIEEFSEFSTIPVDRLQGIEAGQRAANAIEIIRIAMALSIRPAELVLRAEVLAEVSIHGVIDHD
jgi:hypothetical protein